jgi:hypothetical protein
MGVTRLRQDHIWTEGSAISDALDPTDHDANAVDLSDTIDYLASQLADITGKSAWETAPDLSLATINAKTFLDDKLALRRFMVLTDVVVPSPANGSGDSFAFSTPDVTLTDAAGLFTADMVGRDITIAGATTGGNNGTFTVKSYTSPTVIVYENASGAAEAFSGTWAVAGGDFVLLDDASGEAPSRPIATGALTEGAVCVELGAGIFPLFALDEVAGLNALNPKNLLIIFDGATGDPIQSSGRQVYGLLQVENGATDGGDFDDANNQAQISFVRPTATYDDLEACPVADIEGQTIKYGYADRADLAEWTEQDFLYDRALVDLASAAVSVTLDAAYDGGSTVTVDNTHVDWRLTDTKHFYISDSTGAVRILDVHAEAAGDEIDIAASGGINISTGDLTMPSNKATVNGVEVGGAAGRVATLSGDLDLRGADDITFVTTRETSALPLDDATAGPISALAGGTHASISAAIKYAIEHGIDFSVGVTVLSSNYARDVNVPGGAGGLDISAGNGHSIDMNTPSGVDTLVFLNGRLQYGGNAGNNNDVYVGDTATAGDIKFDMPGGVKSGDVIIAVQLG